MEQDFGEVMETDLSEFIEDAKEDNSTDLLVGRTADHVLKLYKKAEDARDEDERRWITSYRNYRSTYGPETQFRDNERSKIFVGVTKTKVLGAVSALNDVLISSDKFPISINKSILPEGVVDAVHMEMDPIAQQHMGGEESGGGEAPTLRPGELHTPFMERLGAFTKKLMPVKDKLAEGPGTTPTQITFDPGQVAAKKMEKKILDQLDESNARKHLRIAAFECALFGTGIMKGPFAETKEYPKWDADGEYKPVMKTVPKTSSVSVWNFYPDPDAANMDEAEWIIERHKMSRAKMRQLNKRPMFRKNAIDTAINMGEDFVKEWWEQEMEDESQRSKAERFSVLEFWGNIEVSLLRDQDVKIPKSLKDEDHVACNIWVCNGQVLRLVMNPFKPTRIPYYAVPYEVNPYSFFGVGMAENMADAQLLMNGFMRMAVDNGALSGSLLIEIDEDALVPGQSLVIEPGKVFRRAGGAPGQAVHGTSFPNVSQENMQMYDKARQLADESSGFPSFAHGQTGVSGVGRTASGISMLMGAANGSIRAVVKNFDDYLLNPMGKNFFHFNMQFDYDEEIQGDLEVKAMGIESLMADEVRSQRLQTFLQVVQNPVLAPFAKMDYIIREIAISMKLDPDKAVNNPSEALLQAEILKKFQQPLPEPGMEGAGGPEGAPGGPPPGANPMDPTGAGGATIGTAGAPPAPGEAGFSANTGEGQA